ncbi:Increased DNA methylation 1 [Bienertia sinuspersici]
MNTRKLLLREEVEVRQLEEGLKGSWYSGKVVRVSDLCREVKYDELLCESGNSKLIESIPVTGAIEGLYQRPCVKYNYRGRIRPVPPPAPPFAAETKLAFGVCVDVLFKEAWWEGVIFDCDESAKERCVYFPDEGDECVFKLSDLRVTSEWDEFTGQWRERGVWTLVNLAKEHKNYGHLFQFIRRVWSHLRAHYGFKKMISEWTCGAYCVWKEYFREVVSDMTSKPGVKDLAFPTSVHAAVKRKRRSKRTKASCLNASVLTRSMQEKVTKEIRLAVRTRRMCMSEAEDSLISAAKKSSYLTEGYYLQSQSVNADACINTDIEVSRTDDNSACKQVPSLCCSQVNAGVVDEGCRHVRMSRNGSLPSTSPRMPENCRKMSNNHSRRSWRLAEANLAPKKSMPTSLCDRKLEINTSCGPRVTRQMHDTVPLQFQDNNPVYKRGELSLLKQKKAGVTMRYPVHRKGRRVRICRRIGKKRSPKRRIKKIYPRKNQDIIKSSEPTLHLEPETSKSHQIEGDLLGSHCKEIQPVTTSSQDHGLPNTLESHKQSSKRNRWHDSVCLVCQYGGELLHCGRCMSSYHLPCIDLKEVRDGVSFCPCCQCGLCGLEHSASHPQLFTQVCYQCSRRYHVACLKKAGTNVSEDSFLDKFCSRSCFEICSRLHELCTISNPTTVEGLTWTITRSRRNDCNVHNERVHPLIQVSQVLNVFHECFEPIIEPHTGRDLVADIVYNSGSKFRRLDFHGFYVIALVDGEELVCVATIRIHGQKVAEMPLVATRFKYRRKGMCRILMDELEKMLVEMGVERLVLPAIAQLSDTWVSSFGFADMPAPLRRELLGYPFVLFQGTTLFQKILRRSAPAGSLAAGPKLAQEKRAEHNSKGSFNLHYKRRQNQKLLVKRR